MARKRRIRKSRGTHWTSESSVRANKARWDADRERRDADMPERLREIAEWDVQTGRSARITPMDGQDRRQN